MSEQIYNEPLNLEALKSGDRAEFARLVERYSNQIYRLALKFLGNPHDAEDVLQETFIKAMRGLPNFEGRSSVSTWLYRIAMNEALMILRKASPEMVPVEEPDGDDEDLTSGLILTDWCCLPEEELLSGESRRFLDQAVRKLPETLRSVFVLRDVEGLSIRDTAEALGISETAVKTRLLRARLKLRDMLSVYFRERLVEKPSE
jgi:RNA polymerase sigma-70 factor (ECF subfamily)